MTQSLEDRRVSGEGEHTVRFEPVARRVRTYFGGVPVADSTHVQMMLETGHLPVYYFPLGDVRMELLVSTDRHTHCPYKGDASYYSVAVGDKLAEDAVWQYASPIADRPASLANLVAFYWAKMDAWFEEDDEVFVHPRDPYRRIDVLQSSRHVQVHVAGELVADTHRPRLLFETSLPTRYYIPKLDTRVDLLETSGSTSRCPYKGVASYYSVRVGDTVARDIAWYYPLPIPECPKIENMVCFYNEKVDAIFVDGELQPKPKTSWS